MNFENHHEACAGLKARKIYSKKGGEKSSLIC